MNKKQGKAILNTIRKILKNNPPKYTGLLVPNELLELAKKNGNSILVK